MRWLFRSSVLLLFACPPSLRRPESAQVILTGSVTAGGFERRGEPLTDAALTVRRADTGEALAANGSSSTGGYRLAFTAPPGTRVVLLAEAPGFAPFAKAFVVGPRTELTSSFLLEPLAPLECVDTGCVAAQTDVAWSEPPSGASGAVASFDLDWSAPVQVDVGAERSVPLAMGFARLSGAGGALRLRVPRAGWSALTDARPGTGVVEVAGAQFDPARAEWAQVAPLVLRSEAGVPVPEAALALLQRGESQGGASVDFPAASGLFIAVLGARPPEGCLTGTVTAEGSPAEGVALTLPGVEPSATGPDGAFCTPAPLGAGSLQGLAQFAGLPYSLGALSPPSTAASCGGACRSVGTQALRSEALQLAAMCRVTGRVVDAAGAPVPSAEVVGFDESVTHNAMVAFCGKTGARCSLAAPSGADGSFTLNAPVLGSLFVGARVSGGAGVDAQRRGGARLVGCPSGPITVALERGEERLEVAATFSGDTLAWQPARAAARVTVLDGATGLPKWEVVSATGLTSPLTYGAAPAGATEAVVPVIGAASGDTLVVELAGVGADGLVYFGGGSASRP